MLPRVLNARGSGWSDARMPPNSVYVGGKVRDMRTGIGRFAESKWFNPYKIGRDGTRNEVIAKYRVRLLDRLELMAALSELRGKDLVCWCPLGEVCHADVLLDLTNVLA
jgi:hypothetical protein